MISDQNVAVYLSGKYINSDTFIKNYLYSLRKQKIIRLNKAEKTDTDNCWEDLYYLFPGKYLIIETNLNNKQHNCICKSLKIFTIEEYLFDMKETSPNISENQIKWLYHYRAFKIDEWDGVLPDWVELPCNCLGHMKRCITQAEDNFIEENEEDRPMRINYEQPKEVESKLADLLPKEYDERPKAAKFLINKNKKINSTKRR